MNTHTQYAEIEELRNEFGDLETPEERIQFLIELGQTLPELSADLCNEENRVLGCQSMVWIVSEWDGTRFNFRATSDAPMVRGLVAVLMSVFSGKTPTEILQFPVDEYLSQLQLKSFLSPLRSNGLYSMIKRIRSIAESRLGSPTAAIRKPQATVSSLIDRGPLAQRMDEIRDAFPILSTKTNGPQIAYLDNAASSQRPQAVIDSISSLYSEHFSNVHRSGHAWAVATTEQIESSRELVRQYIHADKTDEVIFTSGTTASINLIANAWGNANVMRGDEIVLTHMEHHSNIVPWQQLCERVGCTIKWIRLNSDFTLDLDSAAKCITSKTKLISVTAVSNVLGTVNPVAELSNLAHRAGAVIVVDAAQATPHGPIDVQAWDADFVAFSGHKMLASSGVGVCYGKYSLLNAMPAWQGGGSMIKLVTTDGYSLADLPHKLEAGTPPIAEIISLRPAIEYLLGIGKERLVEHERSLTGQATEGLRRIDGVRLYSPSLDQKCGIVSFSVDGIHSEQIGQLLDTRGIAIRVGHHCAMPLHASLGISSTCRASFYLYNTPNEVDRFVQAVEHAVRALR